MDFVAIDFETADHGRESACAVALVKVQKGAITQRVHRLIRPPRAHVVFSRIHGITWDAVRDLAGFREVWLGIRDVLDGAAFLAAHNASFDAEVLEACCRSAGLEAPRLPFRCTMHLARAVWGIRRASLTRVCAKLGIPLRHHDARSDAEACALIFLKAASAQPSSRSLCTLGHRNSRQPRTGR
jgi:DNA polymerase III subunit epsilon